MTFELFRKQVEILAGEYKDFLEIPPGGIADLALPCFAISKKQGKNPTEMAKLLEVDLSRQLKKYPMIKSVRAAGPYLNFYINETEFVSAVVKEVIRKKGKYGSSAAGKGKVIIEYPSPNISKPMSVGHLRSAIIGQSLCNIHRFLGFKVITDDHLGDWGTQFGNLLYAYNTWGNPGKVRKNPIHELLKLYVKFHGEAEKNPELKESGKEWFARLEKGDKKAVARWKLFRAWSLKEFGKTYKRLGLRHDMMLGESFYIGSAKKIIAESLDRGVAKLEEGVVLIPMNGTPLIIQKSDESTLYATRDLATLKYRMEKFSPQKIVYVVGSEQRLYFRQLFFAAKQLGYIKGDECIHVDFGLISLPDGRLSTRRGRVIFLDDLITEAAEYAAKVIKKKNPSLKNRNKVAEMVALAAIKYNDLSRDRVKDIIFDKKDALSFEGDTGPYLQYTCVRAKSILEKSKKKPSLKSLDLLMENDEIEIAKCISKFPAAVLSSQQHYKPHVIANYVYGLAAKFNEYYHKTKIIGSRQENQRLALVQAVAIVLETGLNLLGIDVPEKM